VRVNPALCVTFEFGLLVLPFGLFLFCFAGCVCSKHAYPGTSWTALTLEVGKSPTEVTCGRHVPRSPPSADDRVRFVVEL